ncbi:MAG: SUMF1/EgtB/PvdO family nonheme iron enzyme [Thermoguttaceae bacterium]
MMGRPKTILVPAASVVAGAVLTGWGWAAGAWSWATVGGLCLVAGIAMGVVARVRGGRHPASPGANHKPKPFKPARSDDPDSLVAQMLAQGRGALLLRPQVARDLDQHQFEATLEDLQTKMALVPDGTVVLGDGEDMEHSSRQSDSPWHARQRAIRVAPYFLDRYPVTNRDYYAFVSSGGYEQITYWDTAIWPAVLDFVDQTQQPGPRFWRDGYCAAGDEDHPVVGVCWYEAAAFARWAGKRLPTDAEWVKSGVWPVKLSETQSSQRRYPWGETMDRTKANLWGTGPGRTAPVSEYEEGVSVGGIYQLIGNVWEWTRSDYLPSYFPAEEFISESPLKSVRGGAFDTYFDNQATCQFQSGDVQMARRRNIGFRCALSVTDLMLYRESLPESRDEEVPEEVHA